MDKTHRCNFCGKDNNEFMIVATEAVICNKCLDLCNEILGAHKTKNKVIDFTDEAKLSFKEI
jgi:ATP-dependent protease Clp ATPase subunit